VLWRSGVALARELAGQDLRGKRVVELGCGLAVPSIAAAMGGAEALATDGDIDALSLVRRNAEANGVEVETDAVDWADPNELVDRGPFDLVFATDVLYERPGVAMLLNLLPRLAPVAWVADPGRPAAEAFFDQATRRWSIETKIRGVVHLHRIELA
jgi:predicted nicotinamide N-methyase